MDEVNFSHSSLLSDVHKNIKTHEIRILDMTRAIRSKKVEEFQN